jgi:hypothetical protein
MEALEDEPSWAGGEQRAVSQRGRIACAGASVNKAAAFLHLRRKRNSTTSSRHHALLDYGLQGR